MKATAIIGPQVRVPEPERQLLEQCVHASVRRTPAPLTARERIVLSDRLATEAAWALLQQLRPRYEVEDANVLRRNQPGYDFLIDQRVRVQLKGGTFVESIGWPHSPDPKADRKSVVSGRSVSVRVVIAGLRNIKKKK